MQKVPMLFACREILERVSRVKRPLLALLIMGGAYVGKVRTSDGGGTYPPISNYITCTHEKERKDV